MPSAVPSTDGPPGEKNPHSPSGARVTLLLGSQSDKAPADAIVALLTEYGVSSETIVASAHKVPEKVVEIMKRLNERKEPTVVITIVGMSNGLGGVVAGSCVHPVINCPPFKDHADYLVNIHSNLQMPSDVPVMTVLNEQNAALCALRILGESNSALKKRLMERIKKVKAQYEKNFAAETSRLRDSIIARRDVSPPEC